MLRGVSTASASAFATPPPSPAPSLHVGTSAHGAIGAPAAPPAAPTEAQVAACEGEVNAILSTLIGLQVVRKNGQSDKRRRVDGGSSSSDFDAAVADYVVLRQRHADPSLSSLLHATLGRILVSMLRSHHTSYEKVASLDRILQLLLGSADAGALAENIVKQMKGREDLDTGVWLLVYSALLKSLPHVLLSFYPRLFKTTLRELAAAAELSATLRARLMRNGDVTRAFLLCLASSLPPYFVAASMLNKLRGSPIALVSYLSCLVPTEATHRFTALISSSAPDDYSLAISLHPSPSSSLGWQHIVLRTGVTTPSAGSVAWTSAALRALQYFCQRLPLDALLSPFPRALSPLAGPNFGAQTDSSRPFTSQQLIEAAVLRVSQLLAVTKETAPPTTVSEENLNSVWAEWMVLADQLCVLIQENLLPLGEFFRALLPVATPPISNHVAWLLAQCAIPDEAKEVIINDVGEASGDLLTLFMSFVCAEDQDELRTGCVEAMLWRLRNFQCQYQLGFCSDSADFSVFSRLVPPILQNAFANTKNRRSWFTTNETRMDLALEDMGQRILLSAKQTHQGEPTRLVGDEVSFAGSTRCVPSFLLAATCLKGRLRLIELIQKDTTLFAADRWKSEQQAEAPATLELYARLLYLIPYPRPYRYKLSNALRESEQPPTRLAAFVELISQRLFRLYLQHSSPYCGGALKQLWIDLHDHLSTPVHALFRSLENLLLKTSHALTSLVPSALVAHPHHYGETLCRALLFSLCRLVKQYGPRCLTTKDQAEVAIALEKLQRPQTDAALFYIPESLRPVLTAASANPPATCPAKEAVHLEAQRCVHLKDLIYRAHAPVPGAPPNYQVDSLVAQSQQFFKAAEKKPLLLPTAWMLICELRRSDAVGYLPRLLADLSPRELSNAHYALIDFVLDEYPVPMQPLSQLGRIGMLRETAAPEVLAVVGRDLLTMAVRGGLSLETMLLALADRMDEPNASLLLEHILLTDQQLQARLDFFFQLGLNPSFAHEQDTQAKLRQYAIKFAPVRFPGTTQLTPTYFSHPLINLLPALDVVLCRLIEQEKIPLLERIVERYLPLYAYHERPLGFVKDTLLYYAESASYLQFAPILSRLVWRPTYPFLPSVDPASLLEATAPCFDATKHVTIVAGGERRWSGPLLSTVEISSPSVLLLQTCLVQLLASNLLSEPGKFVETLLQLALPSANEFYAYAAGYFLAQLPAGLHAHMWAAVAAFVKGGAMSQDSTTRWLRVLHSFTRHTQSRLDSLAAFASLLDSAPPRSLSALLFYLSILAPSQHLYPFDPARLSDVICAVAKAMSHPEILQESSKAAHRNELDTILDVLWHWRAGLKSHNEIGFARSALHAVPQPLRERLLSW